MRWDKTFSESSPNTRFPKKNPFCGVSIREILLTQARFKGNSSNPANEAEPVYPISDSTNHVWLKKQVFQLET